MNGNRGDVATVLRGIDKAMAGIRNIFKLNQQGAVLVADSINYLGNKMDAGAPARFARALDAGFAARMC